MRAPAAIVAIPLLVGSSYGLLAGDSFSPDIPFRTAAAALIALLAASAAFFDDMPEQCTGGVIVGTLVVGVSLGTTAATRSYRPQLLEWYATASRSERESVVLEGTLRDDAAVMPTGVSLSIDVTRVGVHSAHGRSLGGVRLSIAGTLASERLHEWRAGRRVRVPASLREPAVYLNPGVPNERRALARRGVALVGTVKSGALVEITARGSPLDEWASGLRSRARSVLSAAVGAWSVRSAGVAIAIVLGDRTGLPQDDERRLQEAGTYHVIAISGGNIAILTLVLLTMMRWLRVPPRVASLLAIVVLLFYGRVAGSSASVDRAIAAAVLYLSAHLLDHRGPPMNTLAVAAIFGIAVAPAAVLDPGFILSFGATVGILIGVRRMLSATVLQPSLVTRLSTAMSALLAATIAAELALFPIAAALFARVTFAGLLLNFAAIPLMTIVQTGSLIVLALSVASLDLARIAGYLVHLASDGLVDSSRLMEITPWLAREVSPPAWWLMSTYYVAIGVALVSTHLRKTTIAIAVACGLLIVASPHLAARDRIPEPSPSVLRVVFLDVGQGDATLVALPNRALLLLVDAGGLPAPPLQDPTEGPAFDVGERVIARALRALGIRTLDAFAVTHGDPDHIGGALSVIDRFRPRAIWEGVPVPPHVPLQALIAYAGRSAIEWRTVQTGDRVRVDTTDILTLHPPLPDWERQRVRNDDSVVLAIRYGDVSIVLPGDIGKEGESQVVRHVEPSPIVILKAPHHGSNTSSTQPFLDALRPRAVVFSAGRNNRFGHPAPTVVDRYRVMRTEMLSTADDGAVILETNGTTVTLIGWHSKRTVDLKQAATKLF